MKHVRAKLGTGTFAGRLRRAWSDTRGLSTVEYVIILVLVAVLGIAVWRTLGETIRTQVGESNEDLKGLRKNGEAPQSE